MASRAAKKEFGHCYKEQRNRTTLSVISLFCKVLDRHILFQELSSYQEILLDSYMRLEQFRGVS